uniref:Link domain-containing protein n=2 Tax=Oreochromis aureus TaxID=47969 RepID=A0AAZ1Y648_OREAU
DRSVRFPITTPRSHCGGNQVGVHTIYAYPNQTGFPSEDLHHDAYCFRAEVPVVHVDNETSVNLTTVTEDLINKTIAITDSTVATTVDYNETETSTNITDIDFVNETIITPQKVIPTVKAIPVPGDFS